MEYVNKVTFFVFVHIRIVILHNTSKNKVNTIIHIDILIQQLTKLRETMDEYAISYHTRGEYQLHKEFLSWLHQ